MQRRKERETDRFKAVADNGTSVIIIETTNYIEAPSFEGSEWVESLKRYTTAPGESLNVTGPGTFETVLTGVTYQRL